MSFLNWFKVKGHASNHTDDDDVGRLELRERALARVEKIERKAFDLENAHRSRRDRHMTPAGLELAESSEVIWPPRSTEIPDTFEVNPRFGFRAERRSEGFVLKNKSGSVMRGKPGDFIVYMPFGDAVIMSPAEFEKYFTVPE